MLGHWIRPLMDDQPFRTNKVGKPLVENRRDFSIVIKCTVVCKMNWTSVPFSASHFENVYVIWNNTSGNSTKFHSLTTLLSQWCHNVLRPEWLTNCRNCQSFYSQLKILTIIWEGRNCKMYWQYWYLRLIQCIAGYRA